MTNTLPCGDCAHLSRTVRTQEWQTRPLGYCYLHWTFKLRSEVVPDCQYAEGLDEPSQRPSTG